MNVSAGEAGWCRHGDAFASEQPQLQKTQNLYGRLKRATSKRARATDSLNQGFVSHAIHLCHVRLRGAQLFLTTFLGGHSCATRRFVARLYSYATWGSWHGNSFATRRFVGHFLDVPLFGGRQWSFWVSIRKPPSQRCCPPNG